MDPNYTVLSPRRRIDHIELNIHNFVCDYVIFIMCPDFEDVSTGHRIEGNASAERETEVWIIVIGRGNCALCIEIRTESSGDAGTRTTIYITDGSIYREAKITGKRSGRSSTELNGAREDKSGIRERLDHRDDTEVGGDGEVAGSGTHTGPRAGIAYRARVGGSPIKTNICIKVTTGSV